MFRTINVGTFKVPRMLPSRDIRVTFANGNTIETWINGYESEILRYYSGVFNLGRHDDDLQLVSRVEFLDVVIPENMMVL